jgi:hypothetical protein
MNRTEKMPALRESKPFAQVIPEWVVREPSRAMKLWRKSPNGLLLEILCCGLPRLEELREASLKKRREANRRK